ncbi:MAG: dienelactone hydrolase family protein [Burkholderiaceae bacterium]
MGESISFKRPDGQVVDGYLAQPANAAEAPGVVVIQEWWGLNDQIRGVADRMAQAGYRALVPDLYRGKMTAEAEEANHLMTSLDFGDAASQDVRGAAQYLKADSPKVGVTGFCMGGALTLLSAIHVPECDAGVIWYGYPPLEYIDASKIKAPLMGHFATQDKAFAIENVDKIEEMFDQAKVAYEFHRYDAMHAFANETAVGENRLPITGYDEASARVAWERTMAFFEKHLS